jgi:hypothetical protein
MVQSAVPLWLDHVVVRRSASAGLLINAGIVAAHSVFANCTGNGLEVNS